MARTHKPGRRHGRAPAPEVELARKFLAEVLADGEWHTVAELRAKAVAAGIETHFLFRAAASIAERCPCWRRRKEASE